MNIYVTGANGRLGKEFMKLVPKAIPLVRRKSGIKEKLLLILVRANLNEFSKKQMLSCIWQHA